MESNKDEAERCFVLAETKLAAGDLEGANKFIKKSLSLFPTDKARIFDRKLQHRMESQSAGASGSHSSSSSSSKGNNETRRTEQQHNVPPTPAREHTPEQAAAVKRILKIQSFYEILDVPKDSGEADIKKAYRKLALQFHPDKNGAPGADEAFKKISDAFAVLSDPAKRHDYDTFGHQSQSSGFASDGLRRGRQFQSEVSPEELFEMFFSGRMGPGGPGVRVFPTAHRRARNGAAATPGQAEPQNFMFAILQFLPILLIIMFYMYSPIDRPLYSLARSDSFTVPRKTSTLQVDYFVEPAVDRNYARDPRSLLQLEKTVEDDYIQRLQMNCKQEEATRTQVMRRAKYYGSAKDIEQSKKLGVPSCDRLQEIQQLRKRPQASRSI